MSGKLQYHWFVATNNPIDDVQAPANDNMVGAQEAQDGRDVQQAKLVQQKSFGDKPPAVPTVWTSFSDAENAMLEEAFQSKKGDALVSVSDDYFDVDLKRRVIYPIYWDGPRYKVLRSSWFTIDTSGGGSLVPVAEQMAQQIEDGFQKYQPWKIFTMPQSGALLSKKLSETSSTSNKDMQSSTTQASSGTGSTAAVTKYKWALFGPYATQYVLFTHASGGWLMRDDLTSTVTQAIYSRMSSGENLGGIRLVRGWNGGEASKRDSQVLLTKPLTPPPPTMTTEPFKRKERNVRHIVFAIHGIGQKLGEKVAAINFVEDCNVLRKSFQHCLSNNVIQLMEKKLADKYAADKSSDASGDLTFPVDEVMVLPIQWRKRLNFDSAVKADEEMPDRFPTIDDISLDTVPSLRNIVSDVILDVLLYMEESHHVDMISRVINECNRLYKLFIKRHPSFLEVHPSTRGGTPKVGECHLYGHSLGSIIASDLVCYHNVTKHEFRERTRGTIIPSPFETPEDDDYATAVDLSDLSLNAKVTDSMHQRRALHEIKESLHFPVSKVFLMGSPLGLFCLLRSKKIGVSLGTMVNYYDSWFSRHAQSSDVVDKDELVNYLWNKRLNAVMHGDCTGLYNIFHPMDAVAHRIEPLVALQYAQEKPFVLPPARPVTSMFGIGEMATKTTGDLATKASGFLDSFKSSMVMYAIQGATADKTTAKQEDAKQGNDEYEMKASPIRTSRNDPAPAPKFEPEEIMRTLNPRHQRLDYAFNSGGILDGYISALGAHFNYWKDEECVTFVLKEILELDDL